MRDSLLPEQGAANAVQQLMGARPTSTLVPRTHPDFSRKLKHLQNSNPVNPIDLSQRLEAFLSQQSAYPDGIVPRRVRRPRTSTTNSNTTSAPPTPPQNVHQDCFHSDSLGHDVDDHELVDNAAGNHLALISKGPESVVKNFAYPAPVAVLSPPLARQSTGTSNGSSLYLTTTLSANLPPPPRSSCIEPLKATTSHTQDESLPCISESADPRRKPESAPYVPGTAGNQIVQATTPMTANRASMHIIPQYAEVQPFESLPFLTLSPLRHTFFNDAPHNTAVNSPGLSALSPGARTSIATESTFANYMTAPSSPAAPPINNNHPIVAPPVEVTSKLEKRKSWHPRSLIASMKPAKSESNDRMQTEFQTTAVMVEAVRQGQAKEVKKKPRATSENLSVGTFSVPDHRPGTGNVPPMPALDRLNNKEIKAVKEGKKTPTKESIWNRRSRRKTTGGEEAEKPKDIATSTPTMDQLRWKQLAMRDKALADSKMAKGGRYTRSKTSVQQTGKPNMDLPTTMFTRPLSSPTPYIPQQPSKPQERSCSPVEVRPMTSPTGENYSERLTSKYVDSPSPTILPLALSMGVSSLPRSVHLLDDTPTSANGPAGTNPFPEDFDRDARVYNPTSHTPETKAETFERLRHQRHSSKPKLLLGPFPASTPVSPSSSPPKKSHSQPPRFAPGQRNSYTPQSSVGTAPAEQLTPWYQPMPLEIPDSSNYTGLAPPTYEQPQPKHGREISLTRVVSAPPMVSSPSISPALEISPPREIAPREILPLREAPAPRDDISSSLEQESPAAPQSSELRPQSHKYETSLDTTRPQLDRPRSPPVLNQYGETPHWPRASSADVKAPFVPSKIPASRAIPIANRPKTSGGLPTTPVYTIEVRNNEIAEMTPASVKLLREQQSLLRRRALAAAVHSDPDAAMKHSPTALAELRGRTHGTNRRPATADKAISRSPAPLAGPGSARNSHSLRGFPDSYPHVSPDRQDQIQTHLGSGAAKRKSIRLPLDSHRSTHFSTSQDLPVGKKSVPGSVMLPSQGPSTMHSASTSSGVSDVPMAVPHTSRGQMAEETKEEWDREMNAARARHGLPARRGVSAPFMEEKFGAANGGGERMEAERGMKKKGRDKWWKIWRAT
ncbi:hypothetical protein EG328_010573 [Venturia inaequalis]|uniref:Uncharacterized protein n=1 Tax=Venturia inaequalis TaxID=5025 RepID=A0A8H3ZAK3_VENIN|nr:hypothetical protein EG328_010573 [Venturia inaequalis]KAE9992365.1 hypothetical protein EG327_009319 [Venturia inaequalis]